MPNSTIKNAAYNAFGYIFPIAIALFTTPYIVHKLTPEIYGIYILATSIMGMMSFIDLGFGQGIIKFVSHYEAQKNFDKINQIIAVTLFINGIMGLIGAVIIFSLAPFLVDLFNVKAEQYHLSVLSFRIVSVGFFIMLLNGVFANIPKALQRYDVSVKIQNLVWLLSVISTVVLLFLGKGLIEVLISYVIFQAAGMFIYAFYSKRLLPSIRYGISFDKETFKEIFGFSIFTAINSMSGNIVFRVDKMIISSILGTEAVTYYQIPFMIVQMANNFVTSVLQFLFPAVSSLKAIGDNVGLEKVFCRINRYTISLTLLINLCLIFSGKLFISIWMGIEFAKKTEDILFIVSVIHLFFTISIVGYYFYNGLGLSKINLISSAIGTILYLIAIVILSPIYGIKGVAIAFGFTQLPFPLYHYVLTKLVGVDAKWYFDLILRYLIVALLGIVLVTKINFSINIINLLLSLLISFLLSIALLLVFKVLIKEDLFWLRDKIRILVW